MWISPQWADYSQCSMSSGYISAGFLHPCIVGICGGGVDSNDDKKDDDDAFCYILNYSFIQPPT